MERDEVTDHDELDVRLERFIAGGEALAREANGQVLFVSGGIPGETVRARVVDRRSDWSRAVAIGILDPSPDRVDPPCPRRHAGCGGCDWQHLAIGAQMRAKVDVVRDALIRTAGLVDPEVRIGNSVPATGSRTSLRVVGTSDQRCGLRRERSHEVVAATGCLIADPRLVDLVDRLRPSPESEVSLRVSAASGERTAWWRNGQVDSVPDDVAIGPDAAVIERVGEHRFRISASSFFQSGPDAAFALIEAVRRAAPEVTEARSVLDAYGGVGLLALGVVPDTAAVTVVESAASACADARVNLAQRDASVIRSDVLRWIRQRRGQRRGQRHGRVADVVIADPARRGLGRQAATALASLRAPVMVLVSCDPAAGARDIGVLVEAGYRIGSIEVLDLFPHTHHVEMVTRFTLAGDHHGTDRTSR